jgi:nucleotide-binding universal stress UspA family protein
MDRDRLICAITDDEHAADVIETGKAIGAATGLEPQYVTVAEVDLPLSPAAVPASAGIGWVPFPEGGYHTAERRAAERAAEFFTSMGLDEPSTRVCTGSTASELNEVARSSGAAAIVLGASPGSAVMTLGIGSVARWLAVNGSCPVVFARSGEVLDMTGPVVCGVDVYSGAASRVAEVAARFAGLLDRELVLVHVGWFGPGDDSDVLDYGQRLGDDRRAAQSVLASIAETLDVAAEVRLEHGEEGDVLAAEAQARNASMLVVGNRGRGPIRTMLAGSVSIALARNARAPVVVVPPDSGAVR